MAQVQLKDLKPGSFYKVQIRSVYPDGTESPWGPLFVFLTDKDIKGPAAPSGLTVTSVGTTFVATWNKPTTNADGSPLLDFKDYEVTVIGDVYSKKFYVAGERFDFTLEMNTAANNGTPVPTVTIEVRSRDISGNVGPAASATGTNPPPAAPTNVVATAITGGFSVSWDANNEADMSHYEVFASTTSGFTPGPTNRIWRGDATNMTHSTLTIQPHYIVVRAVDVVNSGANSAQTAGVTPLDPFFIDTTPPPAPTGVAATSAIDESLMAVNVDVTWAAVTAADLAGYKVRYSTSATGPFSYIDVDPSATSARIRELLPATAYSIGVQAYDYDGNYSTFTVITHTTANDTTAPVAPTGVNMVASLTAITMFWNDNAELDTRRGNGSYEAQVDTASTFDSVNLKTRIVNARVVNIDGLIASTPTAPSTYYGRVRAIDANGNAGPWALTSPASVVMGAAYAGKIGGDIVAAGTLAGGTVIAGTLDAASLKADTAINRNLFVDSTITVGLNNASPGQIKSFDFSATSGYSLTRSGLDIRSGTIAARAIQLQNGQNLLPPQYAGFEAASGYQFGVANGTVVISTEQRKFNSQSLKHANTTTTAESYVYLGAADSIPVEPSSQYIVSAYCYPLAAVNVELFMRNADSGAHSAGGANLAANAWQRVSFVYTSGPGTTAAQMRLDVNTPGVTVYWDGLQVEPKSSGSNEPSHWTPPGLTSIDGGLIKTGSIQSTTGAWAINLNGNATFANARINGTLVVDNSSGYAIQSGNYSGGTAGWLIRGDGHIEMNGGIFRGTVSGGHFSGGSIAIGSGNTIFKADGNGIYLGNATFGSAPFRVNMNGTLFATGATISGNVTANQVGTSNLTIHTDGSITTGGGWFTVSNTGRLTAYGVNVFGALKVADTNNNQHNVYINTNGIYAGHSDPNLANFWITTGGTAYLRNASVKGTVEAGSTVTGALLQTRTSGGIKIGPDLTYYGTNKKDSIVFGGDAPWINTDSTGISLNMGSYSGTNLAIFNISGEGVMRFDAQSTGSTYNLSWAADGYGFYPRAIMMQSRQIFLKEYLDNWHRILWSSTRDGMRLYGFGGVDIWTSYDSGNSVTCYANSAGEWRVATGVFAAGVKLSSLTAYKDNVEDMSGALDTIKKLRPVKYVRTHDANGSRLTAEAQTVDHSFLAEEVAEVAPEMAAYDTESGELYGVDLMALVTTLTKSVQELSAQVEELRAQVPKKRV